METTANPVSSGYTPMQELAGYHQQIAEKYKHLKPDEIEVTPDSKKLIAFNGYYTLDNANGAFFAIDTNIHFQNGSSTPIYDIALLISLSGITSARFPFTGTFDGTCLRQQSVGFKGVTIDLTLMHTDVSNGTTASCSGTITFPGRLSIPVSGATYNNPIPAELFIGEYYEAVPVYIEPNGEYKKEEVCVPVMQIKSGPEIFYDYGANDGILKQVPSFTYNLNMYYFTFGKGDKSYRLIMGSAAAGGLACNNIIVSNGTSTSRSLQTIPFPNQAPLVAPNTKSCKLASFSGYYQISSLAKGAFISIQAEQVPSMGDDACTILIGVSLDGITSNGYYFDDTQKMTFKDNTLHMPEQSIKITFTREYNARQGSLVNIKCTINKHQNIIGFTLFNPVPLSVFGGVPMTNSKDSLTILSNSEVTYNNKTLDSILYVPVMYILANPWNKPTIVMSFGTDGLKGNTCIITDQSGISVVNAIPG
jgi:hypothetical protein